MNGIVDVHNFVLKTEPNFKMNILTGKNAPSVLVCSDNHIYRFIYTYLILYGQTSLS